ncbi:MAG: DUF4468 domain-containing protein [Alloprevotella sp.]|jgi:hypothetical protein|nr:DUF4468 domain-containing protein [Alloprevotella sp.]
MKKSLFLLCVLFLGVTHNNWAQTTDKAQILTTDNYLKGAVTEKNGVVVFEETFIVPGKSKVDIFDSLKNYTQSIVTGENHLPQSRITELSPNKDIIAASVEETLWFKRTALVSDFARFFYQLVFEVSDGQFKVTLLRLRYIYEPMATPGQDNVMLAEEWITDKEALKKDGTQLRRGTSKKFRIATIDRKNQLFRGAGRACGLKFTRIIEE